VTINEYKQHQQITPTGLVAWSTIIQEVYL